jgi:hypothetical protein
MIGVKKLAIGFVILTATSACAQQQDQSAFVQSVFSQLLALPVMAHSPARYASWPPAVAILSTQSQGQGAAEQSELNAFAAAPDCRPVVRITEGLVSQIVQDDPDVLALILGHELGHILLGHPTCTTEKDRTSFLALAATRDQEYAADAKGYELALAAGFSVHRGLLGLQRLDAVSHYSSYEALSADHPSWTDRLARLDKENAPLWHAMSAFDDGASFLATENYALAAQCFRQVVREFPEAADAKSNLGYALLMQYIDQLSDDDVQGLGIGQIATGSFYGESLHLKSKLRGKDSALWSEAVQVLKSAEQEDPSLSLAKANLGLAYLVQPTGSDSKTALEYLAPAVDQFQKDRAMRTDYGDAAAHALINNAAVAYLAIGDRAEAEKLLDFLWKNRREISNEQLLQQTAALYYNIGMLFATSEDAKERSDAGNYLVEYLRAESATSVWWKQGYAKYVKVCSESADGCVAEAQLRAANQAALREVIGVELAGGKALRIGESFQDALDGLGPSASGGSVSDGHVQRTRFSRYSVETLSTDVVLAILLEDKAAPEVHLREAGAGTASGAIRVGMTIEDAEKILANQPYRYEGLSDSWTPYRFYPGVGIALRAGPEKTVEEIVIVRSAVHTESD